jgi:mannose-6-phosphate isomerase-like protein (cupin superfamily)
VESLSQSSAPPGFAVRRVVTSNRDGAPVVVSDAVSPLTVGSASGPAVSELLWLNQLPAEPDDGGEPSPEQLGGFPVDGAVVCRIIRLPGSPVDVPADQTWLRMPGDDAKPGMHRSETLDLMVVLDGHITLGLDDGEYPLGPGDTIVQRGTAHRWRVVGEQPCTYFLVLIAPDPKAAALVPPLELTPGGPAAAGLPRRLVTGTSAAGSQLTTQGAPSSLVQTPGPSGVGLYDLWQTGGPVTDVAQGGDAAGPWQLEPVGAGISLRKVAFGAGHDPGDAGFHTTATIDVDVVLSGSIELTLPGDGAKGPATTTLLRPGDVVVQRATAHRWRPAGSEPAAMFSIMIGLQPAAV